MPILPSITPKRITQEEFKELSYEVMRCVFAIHNDFGRFFDEIVYKRELKTRIENVLLEVPVDVVFESFKKTFFADVIVGGCGLFEFKAAEAIHPKHRGQAINYLMLFELSHGKIVNTRPEQVQHEFVNCHQTLNDRRAFSIQDDLWEPTVQGASRFRDILAALLIDWGTGLEISLYQDAVTHFLGGEESVEVPIPVYGLLGHLVDQRMCLAAPNVAFRITALVEREEEFAAHARKLINHTFLEAIHWANIKNNFVTFRTIR